MQNDSKAILDDILSRWHSHCKGYSPLPVIGVDPIFRGEITRSGWDSADDIMDAQLNRKIMDAVDFQVSEMKDPYRAAIHITARNCSTGRSVWLSPRLPADPLARGVIVVEARSQLTRRLMSVGVM